MLTRARLRDFRRLVVAAIALIALATLAIGLTVWGLRSDATRDALDDASNIATVLAEQTTRSVQSIDVVLTDLLDRVATLGIGTPEEFRRTLGSEETHHLLLERLSRLSQADVITFADHDGRIINFTRQWPIPNISLADRDYYQHVKTVDDRKLYVSIPVPNRVTGAMTIYFARRINGPSGEFLGVVLVGVGIDYFQHVYRSITSLRSRSFLFLRSDGTVLVRYPDEQSRAGQKMPAGSPWYDLVARGGGSYRSPGYFDSVARLVAVRPLREYPLVVNVAVSESAALETWQRRASLIAGGTLLTLLCCAFLIKSLSTQFHRLSASEASIARSARHDALTDLPNRKLLLEKMSEALAQLRYRREAFSVFLFDLDFFKAINDSLGHPIGDALLKAVSGRLRLCTREGDTVARLGGDEFAIIQRSHGDQREEAISLARRLLQDIGAPYELEGHQAIVGLSIGVALAPADGIDADVLLKHADLAMYRAKSEGRNSFRLFESGMDSAARLRRTLDLDLRRALPRNEFELHYQTIIDMATHRPCGAEALVRWHHPRHGLMGPDSFVPLAEETGLIVPLGEWILRRACADAARWPVPVKLAVNLSPVQFRDGRLVETIGTILAEEGLPPQRLELEITESVLLQRNTDTHAALRELKCLGLSIVLDDFGTGYSSLSYLRTFPFDKIKLDRSFVGELTENADCVAIVSAIAGLGKALGLVTVAEGVETVEQLEIIRAAGYDQAQGYLFSRPCPLAELDIGQWSRADARFRVA
jgi:diguanylate cyclase (GGDEF)-like protein